MSPTHGHPPTGGGAGPSDDANPADEPTADELRDDPRLRNRLEQIIPDIVKRTFYAGLGALFTTEEGIRKMATDFQLPKDVVNFLVHQAANSKDELLRIVAKELRVFFENVNLSGELQKLLTSLSFEVKTEIRFIPNDESVGGVKPDVKAEASMSRGGNKMASSKDITGKGRRAERAEARGDKDGDE